MGVLEPLHSLRNYMFDTQHRIFFALRDAALLLNMLSSLLHHPLHFNSTTSQYVPHARTNPQSLDHPVLHSAYFGTRVRHGTLHDADRYPSHAHQEHRQCSAGAEARFPE